MVQIVQIQLTVFCLLAGKKEFLGSFPVRAVSFAFHPIYCFSS